MATNIDTVTIERSGGATPYSYPLGATEAFEPQSITGTFDGTAAGGDFKPTLSLYASNGALLGRWPTGDTVLAGATAEVSWAPFLRPAAAAAAAASAISWCIGQLNLKADTSRGVFFTFETDDAATFSVDTVNNQVVLAAAGTYLIAASCEWLSAGVIPATDRYRLNIIEQNAEESIIAGHSIATGLTWGAQTVWDVDEWDVWDVASANQRLYLTGQTSGAGTANVGAATLFVMRLSGAVPTPFPSAV